MRVVELDRGLFGEQAPILVVAAKAPHQIGQRTGDQKILLHEPQPLSLARGVVGVQHAGERLGRQRFRQRTDEIAAAEFFEIEDNRVPPPPRDAAC